MTSHLTSSGGGGGGGQVSSGGAESKGAWTANDNVIMSDLFTSKNNEYRLDLCASYLELVPTATKKTKNDKSNLRLMLRDVSGVSVGRNESALSSDTKACLNVYAYPRNDKNDLRRKLVTKSLFYDKHKDYEQNHKTLADWQSRINILMRQSEKDGSPLEHTFSASLVLNANPESLKPFLVLVNPQSGAGKAQKIFFDHVLPVWVQSDTRYTVVLTKYANFAREYVLTLKLDEYRGILVVSGDGLVYEVINGLMSRPDWTRAIQTPIGQLPGGSANALACCISFLTGEAYRNMSLASFAASMAFYYSKSKPAPLDLVTIQLSNKKVVYSFLAVEWAIVADVDLESEKYRFLGNTRFLVGALKRILNLRVYRGRISFLPSDDSSAYKPKNPNLVFKPSTTDLSRNHSSRLSSYNDNNNNNNDYSNLEFSGATSATAQAGASMTSESNLNVDFKYLTPIDKPLPNGWLTVEDNFVYFLISYLPLISPDFLSSPEAQLNDGHMFLTLIRQGISKLQLLKLFKDMETGDYLENPDVEYVKIKAFRLEPLARVGKPAETNGESASKLHADENGIIMVDGERVPYGPIQGEIRQSQGRVLVCS